MIVTLNGVERELSDQTTVAEVITVVTPETRGLAVAVNGEVVPRAFWADTKLNAGDQVEVLTASQGG